MARILVVDDDAAVRGALSALLEYHGHTVELAHDGEAGVASHARRSPDLAILDLTLPGISGVQAFEQIRRHDADALAIFLTAFGTIRSAVEAIRLGGFDFLTKPFDNDELMVTIDRALAFRRLSERVATLEADLETKSTFSAIIGRSDAMRDVLRTLAKVAPLDTTVLLLGESGTGKELVAQSLHRHSRRASKPFIAINCGAIAPTLVESELFGHERGAFTDARETRPGRFEQAEGGTILLDEIGELPLQSQATLLRVLQEREISRIGGRKPIPIDVRIVAATNRNLAQAVTSGTFRSDLYYRLNVFELTLPPLRQRREDLPLLIEHFIDRLNVRLDLRIQGVTPAARDCLVSYDWPGNVRELENALQRAMILADGPMIELGQLPPALAPAQPTVTAQSHPELPGRFEDVVAKATERVERTLIENTLVLCRGNRTKTAAALGMSRRTLFTKLKKLRVLSDCEVDDET